MRESTVENYLVNEVKRLGGMCEKFVSPGKVGPPDRLVTWHKGVMHLIELKAPAGALSPAQLRDHKRRRELGVRVFVLRTKNDVCNYLIEHAVL